MVMVSSFVTALVLLLAFIPALHWCLVATTHRFVLCTEGRFYGFCSASRYIRTKLHPCHPLAGSPMDNNPLTSFFCDMTAIPAELRNQHIAITKEVFGAIQTIRELPNGYAFQLSDTQGMLVKTAEFIDKERLCCPFFSFTVEVAPAGGSLWLQMTGQKGVKPFIQAEIGEAVNETVAKSAGFR